MTLEAIHRAQRLYLDADGQVWPVTNWIDADGDECEPEEAVMAVAGAGNRWYALDLKDFEREALS